MVVCSFPGHLSAWMDVFISHIGFPGLLTAQNHRSDNTQAYITANFVDWSKY